MTNSKKIFFIIGLFLTINTQTVFAANQVCFKKKCVTVELAQNEQERTRGLQGRTAMDQDKGMLFLFQKSDRYGFWMKDTKIALDLIWLDAERKIVQIAKDVPPCVKDPCPSYVPRHEALYVLEINAKAIDRLKWKLGDKLDIRLESKEETK